MPFLFMENERTINKKMIIYILGIIGAFVLIMVDQFTKSLAVDALMGKEPITLIDGVLEFRYLENTGAAFGMLKDGTMFFAITSIIVVAILVFYYLYLPYNRRFSAIRVVFIFLASGALGNLIDRISNRYVVDFIYFKLINFPIFNVADIYVTCSMIALALLILFYYTEDELRAFKL